MSRKESKTQSAKISPAFAARLSRFAPAEKVRAIVLLRTSAPEPEADRKNRRAIIDSMRQTAEAALPDIDRILEQFAGQRLSPSANALGSVMVETTPEGINALASSERVKAILEDQAISPLPKRKSA